MPEVKASAAVLQKNMEKIEMSFVGLSNICYTIKYEII